MKPQQNLSFGGEGLSEVNNILKVDLKKGRILFNFYVLCHNLKNWNKYKE